ncbi:hypothetical protein [Komagataeibacter diospyri]|uniref:DUF2335 domain-containing protein n=1 Tax=Komagataeibacter diospyri TaxID=1932662 RepID=A0A4P5NL51_9PROT|nr:hypothetical protein [Komagataeibacter diospyri]GCE82209.1 hypothetical protein MSKU9_0350 [Komagataeibacter diospyri]
MPEHHPPQNPSTRTPDKVTANVGPITGHPLLGIPGATAVFQKHSGPLPPASELAAYGSVQADMPERILRMAEQNSEDERLRLQREQLQRFWLDMTGRILGFLFAVGALISGIILCLNGHDWAGGSIGAAAVGGTVMALITGKYAQNIKKSE